MLSAAWIGYGAARRFVRERLRYVDAAQRPSAPVIAGVVACLVAAPVAWLLPFFTGATALAFGLSVGLGVRSGAKDVKRGYVITSGEAL
jgi:hypothetical protein